MSGVGEEKETGCENKQSSEDDPGSKKNITNASAPLSPRNSQSSKAKRKMSSEGGNTKSTPKSKKPVAKKAKTENCLECKSLLTEVTTVDIPDECDEEITLVNDVLLQNRAEDDVELYQQGKTSTTVVCQSVTNARFYCNNGHMCSLDSGIVERDKFLFLSGYVKPYSNLDPSLKDGAQMDMSSAVIEWYIAGLGNKEVSVNCATACGYYKILSVAKDYEPYFKNIITVAQYTNHFINCLIKNDAISLDEVIDSFQATGCMAHLVDEPSKQDFISHAQFMSEQIRDYMEEPDEDGNDDAYLLDSESFEEFCQLSNSALEKKVVKTGRKSKKAKKTKSASASKATTTPLVREVFTHLFADQMAASKEASTSNEQTSETFDVILSKLMRDSPKGKLKMTFSEESYKDSGHEIFKWCKIAGKMGKNTQELELKPGVFVGFESEEENQVEKKNPKKKENVVESSTFGQIRFLSKSSTGNVAHVQIFMRSNESVLQEEADKREVFGSTGCVEIALDSIKCVVPICHRSSYDEERHNTHFYYQMQHSLIDGSFTALPAVDPQSRSTCPCCFTLKSQEEGKSVDTKQVVQQRHIVYQGQIYCKGSFVMVNNLEYEIPDLEEEEVHGLNISGPIFTEAFRKESHRNKEEPSKIDPLTLCEILELKSDENGISLPIDKVKITVRLYRRPNETSQRGSRAACPHLLYYTEEDFEIVPEDILGIAYVAYLDNISGDLVDWLRQGEKRFYFSQKHDFQKQTFQNVPDYVKTFMGAIDPMDGAFISPPDHPQLPQRLKSLELFAGCGGLSRGLHDSGLCEARWACEFDDDAANAFQLNFPDCTVFTEDINQWLADILEGKLQNSKGQVYPKKHEVEFIGGGPPCQGFSCMNRFDARECANFKNSLVTTYFSVVDYYKPKFFLFENVKNFATKNSNGFLKAVLACALKIGYQVRYAVLQSGSYGVPQSRHRTIIMGALPECKLPHFPKITHAVNLAAHALTIGGVVIDSGISYGEQKDKSAPLREVTVMDAILDLPDIESGNVNGVVKYNDATSTYQQMLRRNSKVLKDHITRYLSKLDSARISFVPYGGDWRDIPNILYELADGTSTAILPYIEKNGMKKVCTCNFQTSGSKKSATKEKIACEKPASKNTLIPWCLPHTADRNNQWRGLYGRLLLDKQFSTTTTFPEPMGKQGKVVHPFYNRCISVRESARSQGFPDDMFLSGKTSSKYRQVGNAVPPPLAEKLGRMYVESMI